MISIWSSICSPFSFSPSWFPFFDYVDYSISTPDSLEMWLNYYYSIFTTKKVRRRNKWHNRPNQSSKRNFNWKTQPIEFLKKLRVRAWVTSALPRPSHQCCTCVLLCTTHTHKLGLVQATFGVLPICLPGRMWCPCIPSTTVVPSGCAMLLPCWLTLFQ